MINVSDCLIQEAGAIRAAADKLNNEEIDGVLNLLNFCFDNKSKLVVTGVGKSGIVARKIAATFSSIGIMSLYLSPLDAFLDSVSQLFKPLKAQFFLISSNKIL